MKEGQLHLVRELVNTYDVEAGTDALTRPEQLGYWLRARGLLDREMPVTAADLRHATALREAIRDLLTVDHAGTRAGDSRAEEAADDTGDGVPADDAGGGEAAGDTGGGAAAAVLTAAADRAGLRPAFTAAGSARLVPTATGVDSALGRLVALVAEAMADGRWRRLKVCRNDACRWAFYDTSRSAAGRWCSMAVCGNRRKARAWRARQRATPPPAT